MFGFGKKKVTPPTQEKRQRTAAGKTKEDYKQDLAKLGLLGIDVDDYDVGNDGSEIDSEPDEADLENELLAILGEDDSGSTVTLLPEVKLHPTPIAASAAVTQAPTSYDPPAESIFNAPLPPSTIAEALQQRLSKYKSELEKATKANEGPSKVRRIGRIVKQYEDAIKDYKKGHVIAFDELPTPPGFGPIPGTGTVTQSHLPQPITSPSQPTRTLPEPGPVQPLLSPSQPTPIIPNTFAEPEPEPAPIPAPQDERVLLIATRQKQFKEAALAAKNSGNMELAKEFLRNSKWLDGMIQAIRGGTEVDMDTLPSVETVSARAAEAKARIDSNLTEPPVKPEPSEDVAEQTSVLPPQEDPSASIFNGPPPPTTIAAALEQRLEKYKSELEKANESNNSGKARRMGRIVKQYEEAIVAHKKGRPIAYDELPTPPGYGPIPIPAVGVSSPSQVPVAVASTLPSPIAFSSTSPGQVPPEGVRTGSINRGANKAPTKLTLQEKQLRAILERQKMFKDAAINAKKRGDIDQAKELLRTSKGFDKLVQASEAGLPVDMATLPSPPEEVAALETSDGFEIVRSADCVPPPAGSAAEIFEKLEEDLREQMKMCMKTRDHFKSMGDVASANRFEKLAIETNKDLTTLRLSMKQNGALPKYHYETRVFSITECNSDLADDEIEICIVKGINFKVSNPTEVDTFVKVELPYPTAEEAQTNKTAVIRDTNNPDYDATFKMKINRTARPFHRFVHRHGGFLRSSSLLGTATVKLLPLETKCTLHDAVDMLEGRRAVGKIEVKVRLREPILTKQIIQKKEKWLSIDRV